MHRKTKKPFSCVLNRNSSKLNERAAPEHAIGWRSAMVSCDILQDAKQTLTITNLKYDSRVSVSHGFVAWAKPVPVFCLLIQMSQRM
ncbi:hypothetical protein FKM82_002452 [Ascaphus truei]